MRNVSKNAGTDDCPPRQLVDAQLFKPGQASLPDTVPAGWLRKAALSSASRATKCVASRANSLRPESPDPQPELIKTEAGQGDGRDDHQEAEWDDVEGVFGGGRLIQGL